MSENAEILDAKIVDLQQVCNMLHDSIQVLNKRIHALKQEIAELPKDKALNVRPSQRASAAQPDAEVYHVNTAPADPHAEYHYDHKKDPRLVPNQNVFYNRETKRWEW